MNYDYSEVEKLLNVKGDEEWKNYLRLRKHIYRDIVPDNLENSLVSEANWLLRSQCQSGDEIGIEVHAGDVVYMDYGVSFRNEAGFQHFGLCMSICRKKALIIPMTSNAVQYRSAYDDQTNPEGKIHLMRLGKLTGMNKESVLFLNDSRYINTARVIDVKAHLDPNSALFIRIQQRMIKVMFSPDMLL